MLSPRLRQKVFDLWSKFWAGGLANPITAIEQITYLLFLKQLEALDEERQKRGYYTIYGRRQNCQLDHHTSFDKIEKKPPLPPGIRKLPKNRKYCVGHNSARWTIIKQAQTTYDLAAKRNITPHEHLSKYVFPWLRELDRILDETASYKNNGEAKSENDGFEIMRNAPMENAALQLPPDKIELLQFAIQTIDELFNQVGRHSANYDLMGDIFEFMLDQIQISGKNGQFRTPRHIIRFMIELLDPQPGDRLVDPAAGTCGFLINSLLHLRKQNTLKLQPEDLRLEWDGTPHRIYSGDPELWEHLKGDNFVGFDNDQTMARIGWMNMILHGVENPRIHWRDSLSKRLSADESNSYDFAFANPPYTGNVDTSDLSDLGTRFPRAGKGNKPITDKSELLFVYLLLDLLKPGGKATVIVPEGVLFGSTTAHRALRRQLLLENRVEAVISLPAGVFQPYTGVKTSILIFQKDANEKLEPGDEPVTREVWFYDVSADGRSLDAKRNERPEENDLWDAQKKYKSKSIGTKDYFKPDIFTERWRDVDERTLKIFPELSPEQGQTRGIHELFSDLKDAPTPQQAEQRIITAQSQRLVSVYAQFRQAAEVAAVVAAAKKKDQEQRAIAAKKACDAFQRELDKLFREVARDMLESGPEKSDFKNYANAALKLAREEMQKDFQLFSESMAARMAEADAANSAPLNGNGAKLKELRISAQPEINAIVSEFAKLDGFEIRLRSLDLHHITLKDETEPEPEEEWLLTPRSWSAPVRVWLRNDEWQSADGKLTGSHDENGVLHREYLLNPELYNDDGTVKPEYLDPVCIEANDLNLAAGRYKPFEFRTKPVGSPVEIITELQVLETRIQQGLERLLAMVGGIR